MRKATFDDLEASYGLMEQAKSYFKENGIDMWQHAYPSRDDIASDIASGEAYVCVIGDEVAGYIFVHVGPEPFHDTLRGTWTDDRPAVFHRSVVDSGLRHMGIGRTMVSFAEDLAASEGCRSMRTETGEANAPMRAMMARLRYSERGLLTFDGSDKIGFEKILHPVTVRDATLNDAERILVLT